MYLRFSCHPATAHRKERWVQLKGGCSSANVGGDQGAVGVREAFLKEARGIAGAFQWGRRDAPPIIRAILSVNALRQQAWWERLEG